MARDRKCWKARLLQLPAWKASHAKLLARPLCWGKMLLHFITEIYISHREFNHFPKVLNSFELISCTFYDKEMRVVINVAFSWLNQTLHNVSQKYFTPNNTFNSLSFMLKERKSRGKKNLHKRNLNSLCSSISSIKLSEIHCLLIALLYGSKLFPGWKAINSFRS